MNLFSRCSFNMFQPSGPCEGTDMTGLQQNSHRDKSHKRYDKNSHWNTQNILRILRTLWRTNKTIRTNIRIRTTERSKQNQQVRQVNLCPHLLGVCSWFVESQLNITWEYMGDPQWSQGLNITWSSIFHDLDGLRNPSILGNLHIIKDSSIHSAIVPKLHDLMIDHLPLRWVLWENWIIGISSQLQPPLCATQVTSKFRNKVYTVYTLIHAIRQQVSWVSARGHQPSEAARSTGWIWISTRRTWVKLKHLSIHGAQTWIKKQCEFRNFKFCSNFRFIEVVVFHVETPSCQENASNIEQHSDASPTLHLQRTTLAFAQNWATLSYFTDWGIRISALLLIRLHVLLKSTAVQKRLEPKHACSKQSAISRTHGTNGLPSNPCTKTATRSHIDAIFTADPFPEAMMILLGSWLPVKRIQNAELETRAGTIWWMSWSQNFTHIRIGRVINKWVL